MTSHILVIAEKPSVAQSIAAVLGARGKKDGFIEGNGYLVSWCVGHLIGLAEAAAYGEQYRKWSYDSLPILPQEWKYTVAADKKAQFDTLKDLMRRDDVSEVVNACDAGREGELIFRFVYEVAGCKKPMRRLWISSMEDEAIRDGFSHLKDGRDYDPLFASALCRAKADWIIGINATRLFSCLYNHTLNVGRVQTPTLKMLVDRDAAITTFKKEKYYHVRLMLSGAEAISQRFPAADEARELKTACEASQAVCASVVKEPKTAAPPKLFDLTSLQREANRIFGYTAKQTLDLAQALYEKRLLTYPRTDSSYLTDDMGDTAAGIITMLCGKLPFMEGVALTPEVSRLLNSKKVSDHHAIIPTMELAKTDLSGLPETERNILTLAGARLLMAAAEPHTFEAVTAVFECAGQTFTAKARAVLSDGWKGLERRYRATLKTKPDPEDSEESGLLPGTLSFTEGQTFDSPTAKVTEHDTTPPKPHNEASLLSAMEHYYLTHDIYGDASVWGAPYVDAGCRDGTRSPFVIVYAHHMSDGTMFGPLEQYAGEAFAAAHRTILVYTREGTVELEVFAADVLDANREGVRTDFADAAELQAYVDERLERCEVVLDHPEDVGRVWAFATCSYQTANSRTVVLAREVG